MLIRDWIDSKLDLVIVEEQSIEVDRFRYMVSCFSPGNPISEEGSSRIRGAFAAFM